MGICFSSKPSSPSFDSIRVVHLNGHVEDFEDPTTVKQITANHAKHYVCTMAQLLPSSPKLPPETQLQPGKVYFLLPYSLFQSETTPANMVAIGLRLTVIANRVGKVPPKTPKVTTDDANKFGVNTYKEQTSFKPILEAITEKSMEHIRI